MLLKIENLRVNYGNVEALHGVNLEVNEGEIVTILGANGAGKSTTLNAISGLVNITGGRFSFAKQPCTNCLRTKSSNIKSRRALKDVASSRPSPYRKILFWERSRRQTPSASRKA